MAFAPDGRSICSGSSDLSLRFWAAPSAGQPLPPQRSDHTGSVLCCAWSPDGRSLATGGGIRAGAARSSSRASLESRPCLRLWDAASGTYAASLSGHPADVACVAFSADCQMVLGGSYDGTLRLWPAAGAAREEGSGGCSTFRNADRVFCCAFLCRDGSSFVSGGGDSELRVWDASASAGAERFVLSGHSETVRCCAVSADGSAILSGSHDKTLRVWDAATGGCRRTLGGFAGWVLCCAFSPDSRSAVGGDETSAVRIFDVDSGKCWHALRAAGAVSCCAFSADGAALVCGGGDTLLVVDPGTGEERCTLRGHTAEVTACAWVDADTVVSASTDGTARWWSGKGARKGGKLVNTATFFSDCRITAFAAAPAQTPAAAAGSGREGAGYVALGSEEGVVMIIKRSIV